VPAAAISAEDVEALQRMQDRGERVVLRLTMGAETLPDVESANVVAELRGREQPDEIVLISGHLDSWDISPGAIDNAGGCVVTWEALKLLKQLNLVPRRTIRLVLFTNEENGLRGGNAYRDRYRDQLGRHVLAFESDAGVFHPEGFGFSGSDAAREVVRQIAELLAPLGPMTILDRAEAPDLGPIVRESNMPSMSLYADLERYFETHHTAADTIDRIRPEEIAASVAAVATMVYVVADMPAKLER
jgi:carboxypeptidase Q